MNYSLWGLKESDTTEQLSIAQPCNLYETRNPSHQTSEGYRLEAIFPWLLLLVKNACIMEAKTVNASTEFIIRDMCACLVAL